jgi:ABC-2 type transport system permease protein
MSDRPSSTARNRVFDLHRLAALIAKEFTQIGRDPSVYLLTVGMPLVLLFVFGFGISLDTTRARILLVNEDSSAPALALAQSYMNSPYFETTLARDARGIHDALVSGEATRGAVVIPQDFGAQVKRGGIPTIQVITDGSQPNTANFVGSYAQGVYQDWLAAEGMVKGGTPEISASTRVWYNPELKSRYFLVPGSIAVVMTMIGTMLTALVVAREWERGTMEALLATPVSMPEFIASKVVPYFLLALGSMAICTVLALIVFGVPFRGTLFALLAIASAFMFPALGLGLIISSVAKSQFVASQVALLAGFLPTFLLSGFIFEISSMPWWIQAITYVLPARYLIPSLQTVFLVGDVWPLILPNIAVLIAFGAIFFVLAFRLNRRVIG